MNKQIASSSINEILNIQKTGAFMALIYAIISFVVGFVFLNSYFHSVPLFISGLLMVHSFQVHYKKNKMIEEVDFYKTAVNDYLKMVLLYEDWILKSKKSDFIITFFWVIAIVPVYVKYVFHHDVYQDGFSILLSVGVLFTVFLFIGFGAKLIYKDYDKKFNSIKIQLEEIVECEKE